MIINFLSESENLDLFKKGLRLDFQVRAIYIIFIYICENLDLFKKGLRLLLVQLYSKSKILCENLDLFKKGLRQNSILLPHITSSVKCENLDLFKKGLRLNKISKDMINKIYDYKAEV